jgi:hypothetical protein
MLCDSQVPLLWACAKQTNAGAAGGRYSLVAGVGLAGPPSCLTRGQFAGWRLVSYTTAAMQFPSGTARLRENLQCVLPN